VSHVARVDDDPDVGVLGRDAFENGCRASVEALFYEDVLIAVTCQSRRMASRTRRWSSSTFSNFVKTCRDDTDCLHEPLLGNHDVVRVRRRPDESGVPPGPGRARVPAPH